MGDEDCLAQAGSNHKAFEWLFAIHPGPGEVDHRGEESGFKIDKT